MKNKKNTNSSFQKRANRIAMLQIFGIFTGISYWLFSIFFLTEPLFSAKTDAILMLWVFPVIGAIIVIISGVLTVKENEKYDKVKKFLDSE